ncbi:MAG: sigma-54 dependent transcriptional regulator [Proteobacteria bacterium]|nr:sigma-54 dependent transcriptional regulator [Pseudomonadota bacterium]MBU4296289.1 sigma-54 dependent transcriptional regulator [Pseudomonadota bacterium]MCG2748637.1 sigma-54 dependent transcriptional regulator [Desulfobulbaceae bacterium]
MHTILVVDDEPNYLIILAEILRDEGFEVFAAENGEKALEIVRSTDLDLVLTDMQMPVMGGMELLRQIKTINRNLPVIMLTAYGEVDKAVAAMREGAFNYLTKPFKNDELIANITKAVEHYSLLRENTRLRSEVKKRYSFAEMIGKNKQMQLLFNMIEKVAPTSASVLITGESGTGKELVARAIHNYSLRDKEPFISINCAALPESLLESELFGHEKGAFTGAIALRKGRFELADRGTLFLDEIGEMALSLQAKLLRIIQERTFQRVGGTQEQKVDVRIVAATNKDLKEEVEANRFREDLYYRLNVLHVHLPPLRERIEDIPLLAEHFVSKFARRLNKLELKIAPATLRLLTTLPWVGNVRELENTIERASILCLNNTILPEDVQPEGNTAKLSTPVSQSFDPDDIVPPGTPLPVMLDAIEEKALRSALSKADFVQTKAADSLGITKSLLQYKMKKFGIKKN